MAPLDGLASVTMLSTLPSGQGCANTVHIAQETAGTPPSPAVLAQLAADWLAYFETTYRAILTTDSTFDSIKVAQVPDPTIAHDAYADFLLPVAVAGTRTPGTEKAPEQACMCVSLKTNSGQRSYRGHLLLPSCISVGDLDGQDYDQTQPYYVAGAAFATKLQTGVGPAPTWTGTDLPNYSLSIYSRTLQTRAMPSVTGVVTVVPRTAVHWLRSRARGTT